MTAIDPLELSRALIRCPSVTPTDAGALDVLVDALEPLGFNCHRLTFEAPGTAPVANLWARRGDPEAASFCFAGHCDVVPPGDAGDWSVDPFAGEVRDGRLWGRGASDMKTAIACFIAAVAGHLAASGNGADLPISLLITGDEEGPAVNGTVRVLDWLADRGERIAGCLVGEPTNPTELGEMVKIGRRGSLNGVLTVEGMQGHTAYPDLADNPIPTLMRLLQSIDGERFDDGTAHFQPSRLVITSIDVGNPAANVIPTRATARFNVRFNDIHNGESLRARIEERLHAAGGSVRFRLETQCSGEAFLTRPGRLSAIVEAAVAALTGRHPVLSTSGGTSDARFLKDHCPVVEFGMVGESAHKVDESVAVADLATLTAIYAAVLRGWFASEAG